MAHTDARHSLYCTLTTTAGTRVYVHCTAGLGRAPAVCIAYLYWWCGMDLDDAYRYLTDIRPCGPKVRTSTWGHIIPHMHPVFAH